jgi:hypothetical protein
MKKQLYDLGMQILMLTQILASQNKVMMTALKLQCYYGLSEDQILRLPKLFEMYCQKSWEDSYNLAMTPVQQGDDVAERRLNALSIFFDGSFAHWVPIEFLNADVFHRL